jgi:uncharacterized protein YjbI with pentapeptide repeats
MRHERAFGHCEVKPSDGLFVCVRAVRLKSVRVRRFNDEDLIGAEFRECDLSRARLVGVVMQDVEIDGLVTNLVVTTAWR